MNSLIVFAKAPRAGEVKTRLFNGTPLSEDEVCSLYRAFLCDALAAAGRCQADRVIVNYLPAGSEADMAKLAQERIPREKLVLKAQSGDDFSQRVSNSFRHAAAIGAASSVMIGSDSPTLQPKTIDLAFRFLGEKGGVALGPSGEGGLYLIGLASGFLPDFTTIFGGSTELLNFTRQVDKAKLPLLLLEEVTDVDVASDLVSLISIIAAMKRSANYTELWFPENTANMIDKLKLGVTRRNGTRNKVIVRGR